MALPRITVLISGRGSNMRSIVEACESETWPAQVVAVISNRSDAAGLAFASQHGIVAMVVDHKTFATREAFDAALAG